MTGEELRAMLKGFAMPQRDAAHMLGVDYATLKRWMAGTAKMPRTAKIVMIAMNEGRISERWIDANVPADKLDVL